MTRHPPRSTLFPYTPLSRSPRVASRVVQQHHRQQPVRLGLVGHQLDERASEPQRLGREVASAAVALVEDQVDDGDRKSTRLNSSHSQISYAVFCLKKKN